MMERACLPEPPCDCRIDTSCPVLPFQRFAKAWLISVKSSRVGSYETFSSVSGCAADGNADRAKPPVRAMARGILIKSRRRPMGSLRINQSDGPILEATPHKLERPSSQLLIRIS